MAAPLLYGKYQLIDLIARGGMAEVYKAKSHGVEGFEKLVVIKRILPELSRDAAFVDMFINEAKIAVTLNHANIVQVFDLGRSEDSYFIAMEYVHGLDLAEILARARAQKLEIPPELAVYLVSEVAKGLDYAHRRKDQDMDPLGIVHRDVSPQNILISFEGEVKLTDFGIAWAMGEAGAESDRLKGKARYMAPEQARGEELDRRADLFSLGVVLYEILAGENPLRGTTEENAIERLMAGSYPPLAEQAPEIPEELAAIVDRVMAFDPEQRPADAGRFYEELVSFLYTTRRRVGVNELTTFLSQLREVESPRRHLEDADRTLREAFDAQAQPTPRQAPRRGSTPIEVPTQSLGPKSAEDGSGARRLPTELWDITALAWQGVGVEDAAGVAAEIDDLIEREGGRMIEATDQSGIALFGLDHWDGRDTESAIAAGLKLLRLVSSLRERGSTEADIGVGVHSSKVTMVPSGALPREDRRYYGLVEEARALATRRAEALVVSGEARRVGQEMFLFQHLGGGEWLVEGERPIGEVYGRFIGRSDELRRVGEQLAYSYRGTGSVLFVVGEPGTGKTRLLHETRKRLAAGGHEFNWYQARCAPQLHEIPYSALSLMLRSVLGLEETASEDKVREQVERLRELGLGAEEVSAVGLLLGATDADDQRSSQLDREVRMAMLHIATKLAQDRLTVLAWDAAERMDRQTIESLTALSHGATWSRVLVLLASRGPLSEAWDLIANTHTLELGPLADEDAVKLAAARIGVWDLPEELIREILHKTGGNPLYIEEYVKALVVSGAVIVVDGEVTYSSEVAEIEVPKSLRGLLSASIERLEANLRGYLQRAAVLAPRFSVELLAGVAETTVEEAQEASDELWRLGILERTGREELGFVNDMLRDVVFEGITYSDRREIHRRVAEEMERLHVDRLEEVYDRLAFHFRESGQRDRAVEYLCAAGDKLTNEAAHQAAFNHFLSAVDLAQTLPEPDHQQVLEIYQRLGEAAVEAGITDVAIERMRLGVELAEAVGEQSATVRLLTLLGRLLDKADRLGEAHRFFSEALKMSEEIGDEPVRRAILGSIGESLSRNGEYRQATEYLDGALELARAAGDRRRETNYLRELGLCWAARGHSERAIGCIEAATEAASALGDRLLECETFKFRGLVNYMVRDDEGALSAFQAALDLAKEYGFTYEIAANSHNIGDIQIRTGDYRGAFTALSFSHEVARQHGFTKLETLNLMLLGFIDAVTFGNAEGIAVIERAFDFARDHGYTWDAIQATYFLGKALLSVGEVERAREALREAIRLGRATDSRLYVEECELLLADIEADLE